ncbi:MAG: hypothetical protein FVQ83_01435 [Chloroflexi bacterium]|nr:hypothetical protein [Chloroflexota bacterium]
MKRIVHLLALVYLSACSPPVTTAFPTDTPTALPSPTETIVWFPPTSTPTVFPSPVITPTEDLRPGQGETLLQDDFDSGEAWSLVTNGNSSVSIINNHLTLALSEPGSFLFSTRNEPVFADFYIEINAKPSLCVGADEYGLLVRVSSSLEYYRFSLSCDGRARLDRFFDGQISSVVPWISHGVITPGALSTSRLAVWANGDQMRFFVNDQFLFSARDTVLYTGTLGVFVRTAGETPVTVSFTDMVVRQILEQ